MKKRNFILFLIICSVLFFSNGIYASGTRESAENAAQTETRMVTDMRGRSVEVPVTISRAASVFPYVTFLTLALGGGDVLVGIDSASAGNENLIRTYPEMKDIPAMGMFFNVNPESILEADPQVVFTVNWDKDPDKTQDLLNVPVICIDLNLYRESIEFLSGILGSGAESRGNELVSWYEDKKDFIAESINKADVKEPAKVYIVGGKGIHSTFGKESTWQYEIEDAGGVNVAADVAGGGAQEVSAEQIIIWKPDVIILDSACPDSAEDLLNNDTFRDVPAVKTKRIYRAPVGFLDTFGRPHMESALARLWLADKLYPDEINIDIVDEAKKFYSKFYGAKLSDSEIDAILNPVKQSDEPSNITVTDSIGNKVLIPAGDKKVASLRSGITEIICALGAVDSIIAVDEMTKDGYMYGEFISLAYPQLMEQTAPYSGRDVNIEELLSIEPDLVLHGGFGRIRQADSIKNQAPELPVVIAHFETMDAYMDDIRIVGKCVNAEDRAEVLITYLQQKLDMIKELTKKIPEDRKKSVFYGGHDVYHAYGGNTFEHFQIVNAGGVNPAESLTGWMPEVSPEQLLNWNPDVIILLNGADVEAVMNDDRIESISAIRNGNVYALPQAGWDFSTPRALFCIEWIFSKLYPEEYSSFDINKQADDFFMQVFNVSYEGPEL